VVFGSPKNRLRGALPSDEANELAADFFREIGDHAAARGVTLCIEANPRDYGCDFVTTTDEAVALCRLVGHPGIRVNGDLGGMTMSGEDPRSSVVAAGELLAHFHASEPNLAELGAGADHARAALALAAIGYRRWVSIEMRPPAPGGENAVDAVERAVRLARRAYGSKG
jgi:sugar phosphate isomerase/epimerase